MVVFKSTRANRSFKLSLNLAKCHAFKYSVAVRTVQEMNSPPIAVAKAGS